MGPCRNKIWYISVLSILISTLFFYTKYKVEVLPKNVDHFKIKENTLDSPETHSSRINNADSPKSYIPLNKTTRPRLYISMNNLDNRTQQAPVDFRKETARISHNGTRADDPYLVELIRRFWIRSPPSGPYQFKAKKTDYSTHQQSVIIDNALNNKEGGFYVECGACDGEFQSNTLYLELQRKWTGLLIEPNRKNYAQLLKTNRKAYYINACLSPYNHPAVLKFKEDWAIGHLEQNPEKSKTVDVQCFPFYSILLALNITHIDVFSLDVEGAEVLILDTVPFDKVDISMLNVEYQHVKGGSDFLQTYMESKGYVTVKKVFRDLIVKKKGLQ